MLSRVAESLYWMSRYIERAEDMTRILAVNFLAQLDAPQADTALAWYPIVAITGDERLFHKHFAESTARHVTEFFLWHPSNHNGVMSCIHRARENARAVREQITVEMWEHINRLFFLCAGCRPRGGADESGRVFSGDSGWVAGVSGDYACDDDAWRGV